MKSTSTFPLLFAAGAAQARPYSENPYPINAIRWRECEVANQTTPLQCATLAVPRDYTAAHHNATIDLPLIRVVATEKPSLGSIIFNFGGPGGDGKTNMAGVGAYLLNVTGGHHDLVSFDPRGTGDALPYVCYEGLEEVTRITNSMFGEVPSSSDTALENLWADGTAMAARCAKRMQGQGGELVGTVATARDVMRIVDALGDSDGLLRYWGISYGTSLGATISSLFPERVDKVILDGVQNPTQYHTGDDFEMFTDSDKTFRGFLEACVASPKYCTLANGVTPNATADDLEAAWEELLEYLHVKPIVIDEFIYDYAAVTGNVLSMLYWPTQFTTMATQLTALMSAVKASGEVDVESREVLTRGESTLSRNGRFSAATASGANDDTVKPPMFFGALSGIRCSDKPLRASSASELLPAIDNLRSISKWFGESYAVAMSTCRQWPFQAVEQYNEPGAFQDIETRNPLLVIGNTYDPVTPLTSARNVSMGFVGSVVLHQDSFGHTSMAHPSKCTGEHVRKYLFDGVLPEEGTVCKPDAGAFELLL